LQVVLSVSAKKWKTSITVHELTNEICLQFIRRGVAFGPRYRVHIFDAIKREVRSRRLRWINAALTSVEMTPAGLIFYKEFGTVPLYGRKHPRMRYLSIRKLRQHTIRLHGILEDMHDAFDEFHEAGVATIEALPDAVEELYAAVENLEHQNSALQLKLNYQKGKKLRLQQMLGANVPE
ncbi:hypothetical protein TRAPUB_6010, partial [Trametes pubescens]